MTHKQRVLELLSDNQPHSHLEGYRLGVMLHSRVADLRKDGYTVKCWAEKGAWWYQLFGSVREAQGAGCSAAPDGNPGSRGPSRHGPPGPASQTPESAEAGLPGGPRSSLPFVGEGHQPTLWESAA